ncbi:MAG: hypothetical protein WAT12_14190 [Candidatus Nitrotoga sp.]
MHYRRADAAGDTYFFTDNLAERRFDVLVRHIDDLRAATKTVKDAYPFYSGDGGVAPDYLHAIWRLPPTGRCRLSAMLVAAHQGRLFPAGGSNCAYFVPDAKPSVSEASGSGAIGNIKSGMKLILRDTLTTFIPIP